MRLDGIPKSDYGLATQFASNFISKNLKGHICFSVSSYFLDEAGNDINFYRFVY